MHSRTLVAVLSITLLVSGCGRNMSSDTYTSGSASGKVLEGKIVSARHVVIKDSDKLQDNALGGLAGGAAGAVGGSTIGSGSGSTAAAIGGAVLGAVAGAYAQDALSTSEGTEYIVKLDKKYVGANGSKSYKSVRASTKGGVSDDVNASIDTNAHTDMLSVVQATDPALRVGSRVYIIYSDDRPRLSLSQ